MSFRFSVQSFRAGSGKAWRERARRVEALGYSALHLADHFVGPGPVLEATNHPLQELAAVPAIAVAAEATSSLRVGCRVFCVDYRHPVMLAKEAATLDLLSEGRLELGLGAGWLRGEYEAAEIRFDPPGVRIARLAEVVALAAREADVVSFNFDSSSGVIGPEGVRAGRRPAGVSGKRTERQERTSCPSKPCSSAAAASTTSTTRASSC